MHWRLQNGCQNIRKIAWVSYPGLPSDKYHAARKEIRAEGLPAPCSRLVSRVDTNAGVKLVSNVKLFSHRQYRRHSFADHSSRLRPRTGNLSDAQKIQAGAGPDVVRLSIGLEDKDDIIADLAEGLKD